VGQIRTEPKLGGFERCVDRKLKLIFCQFLCQFFNSSLTPILLGFITPEDQPKPKASKAAAKAARKK
jgi:hypothetical protein